MPISHHLKRPPMVTAGSSSSSLGIRPQGPLARPSYSRSGSSSSSLSGTEQSVQPFQDFIKQTRTVDAHKPLPPTPMAASHLYEPSEYPEDRRSHSFDRRSSSVYSRTQSQWIPDTQSHDIPDIDYDSYMQPESYNLDLLDINVRQPTPDHQSPRHCSPLITSPSPTLSAVSTLPKSRPPTFMLDPTTRERPKVRLLSVGKAIKTFNALGMVHLLPEELRAQSSKKADDARKHVRMYSEHMFSSPRPPPLPPAAIFHGPERSHSTSTGVSVSPFSKPPRDAEQQPSEIGSMHSMNTFHVGTGPAREMAPPRISPPSRQSEDEERGRMRERSHSSREYAAPQKFFMHDLNSRPIREQSAGNISHPSESEGYDSEDDVRSHMKMIPQPLFQAKSPIQHRKPSDAGIASPLGYSAFRMQRNSQESASSGRSSGFPLRLSLSPPPGGIRHRQSKSSTTGMIPISPPSENDPPPYHIPPPIDTSQRLFPKPNPKHEAKVSSLYPRLIGRNKKKKVKSDIKVVPKRPSVGAPLLPADVVAAVLLTPDTTPQTSPLASDIVMNGLKRTPSGMSKEGKKQMFQRFKGMAKQVRKGSKQQEMSPEASPVASPQSPHLFASPVKTSAPAHVGWTDTAKATWDQARANAFPSRRNASHATSLGESGVEEEDGEESVSSRPTLFGPFVESYRETRAQKRREDLKKTIKVVTPVDQTAEAGESDDESERESAAKRRLSGYWM